MNGMKLKKVVIDYAAELLYDCTHFQYNTIRKRVREYLYVCICYLRT